MSSGWWNFTHLSKMQKRALRWLGRHGGHALLYQAEADGFSIRQFNALEKVGLVECHGNDLVTILASIEEFKRAKRHGIGLYLTDAGKEALDARAKAYASFSAPPQKPRGDSDG
jgi:hypothetical protein